MLCIYLMCLSIENVRRDARRGRDAKKAADDTLVEITNERGVGGDANNAVCRRRALPTRVGKLKI